MAWVHPHQAGGLHPTHLASLRGLKVSGWTGLQGAMAAWPCQQELVPNWTSLSPVLFGVYLSKHSTTPKQYVHGGCCLTCSLPCQNPHRPCGRLSKPSFIMQAPVPVLALEGQNESPTQPHYLLAPGQLHPENQHVPLVGGGGVGSREPEVLRGPQRSFREPQWPLAQGGVAKARFQEGGLLSDGGSGGGPCPSENDLWGAVAV